MLIGNSLFALISTPKRTELDKAPNIREFLNNQSLILPTGPNIHTNLKIERTDTESMFCVRGELRHVSYSTKFLRSLIVQMCDFLCFAGTDFCDWENLFFLAGNYFLFCDFQEAVFYLEL